MTWILVHESEFTGLQRVCGTWSDLEIEKGAQRIKSARLKYDIMEDADDLVSMLSEFLPEPIKEAL